MSSDMSSEHDKDKKSVADPKGKSDIEITGDTTKVSLTPRHPSRMKPQ